MQTLLAVAAIALAPFLANLTHPVQVVWPHDHSGRFFVAEQDGRILSFDRADAPPSLFLDLRPIVSCCTNGGLLSIVFHPSYALNGKLYVQYVNLDGDTVVACYIGSTPEILFVVPQPKDNIPNHHGGTLEFGPDGYLYISIGDGGAFIKVTGRAQDTSHLLGKLLRIDVDHGSPYSIPADNPFVTTPGARGEIWSIGLRNPWRFSFDRDTGDLYLGDVGQDSWEEVNVSTIAEARGANFGWPIVEGSHCFPPGTSCDTRGLTAPRFEYSHDFGCSVTGGYRHRGVYYYADWCSGRIWGDGTELLETDSVIVSFGEDDDGELYVVDYSGRIFRLIAPPMPRRRAAHH